MVAFEAACFVSFLLSVFVDFDLTLITQNLHTRKICEPHALSRPLLCHVFSKLLLLTLKLAAVFVDDDELVVFDLVQFSDEHHEFLILFLHLLVFFLLNLEPEVDFLLVFSLLLYLLFQVCVYFQKLVVLLVHKIDISVHLDLLVKLQLGVKLLHLDIGLFLGQLLDLTFVLNANV